MGPLEKGRKPIHRTLTYNILKFQKKNPNIIYLIYPSHLFLIFAILNHNALLSY